ncbi:MAG: hypothetical protein ACR2P2_10905 [Nakamurella sp.]
MSTLAPEHSDVLLADRSIDFRYAPPSRWTLICPPDDPHKTLVREDGALLYHYRSVDSGAAAFDQVLAFTLETAGPPLRVQQQTHTPGSAIVTTTLQYQRATLHLVAFSHVGGAGSRCDVVQWRLDADPGGDDEVLIAPRIDVSLRTGEAAGRSAAPARTIFTYPAGAAPGREDWALETRAEDLDAAPEAGVLFHSSLPLSRTNPPGYLPITSLHPVPRAMGEGQSWSGSIVVPLGASVLAAADLADLDAFGVRALAETRDFWASWPGGRLPLTVPDPAVQDMLISCARNMAQAREIIDGHTVLQVGPTVYRGLWLVDGYFLLEAARYLHWDDIADDGLEVLLRRVKPSGAIIEIEELPHLKETAVAVATIARQAELTEGKPTRRELRPTMINAMRYLERLRSGAASLAPQDPSYRLMPPAFGDGGLAGERAEYTTAMWTLIGFKAFARAARRLGEEQEAQWGDQLFSELRTDVQDRARADRLTLPDGTYFLPQWVPSGSGRHQSVPDFTGEPAPHFRLQPQTATWAYAQAIWPGCVFPADHELTLQLCHLFEVTDDVEGIPAESGWLPYRAVWSYAASFAAHVWLYVDRPDKAIDYLYAFANHAAPTRVWREEQSFRDSQQAQSIGDMPHNWASAEFIRLVRDMLVFEVDDKLRLLSAVPRHWYRPGAVVTVDRTPTRFGPITLTVTVTDDTWRCDIVRDAPPGAPPDVACTVDLPGLQELTGAQGSEITVTPTGLRVHTTLVQTLRFAGRLG